MENPSLSLDIIELLARRQRVIRLIRAQPSRPQGNPVRVRRIMTRMCALQRNLNNLNHQLLRKGMVV